MYLSIYLSIYLSEHDTKKAFDGHFSETYMFADV